MAKWIGKTVRPDGKTARLRVKCTGCYKGRLYLILGGSGLRYSITLTREDLVKMLAMLDHGKDANDAT